MTMIPGLNNADLFLNNHSGEFSPIEKWLLSMEYPWGAIKNLNQFVETIIESEKKKYSEHKEDFVPWSLKIFSHEDCVLEPNITSEGFIMCGHHTKIESGCRIIGNVVIGDNCIIESDCRITGNVVIGNNVHIYHGATITGSSPKTDMPQSVWIGNNVKIYQSSVFKASIVMEESRIYSNCYVGASVIGKDVLIGSGVKMVDAKFRQKDKMIIIRNSLKTIDTELTKFGSAIGNGSEFASNVTAYPGTIMFPGCFAPANETIQDIYDRKIK